MEPDAEPRAQPADQRARDPRLPLGEAAEVAVEVGAGGVRARAGCAAVGVEVGNDPELGVQRRARAEQPPRDGRPGGLVAVDGADDQQLARRRVAEPVGVDRAPCARTAQRAARRGASLGRRTWMWLSWLTSGITIRLGPRSGVRGPTKTFVAPARTKRSTRSCASARSICATRVGATPAGPGAGSRRRRRARSGARRARSRRSAAPKSPPRGRLRSPMPTRGASGMGGSVLGEDARAPCGRGETSPSAATAGSARASSTGSHVKWSSPSRVSWTPFESRPFQGSPSAYESRVSAPAEDASIPARTSATAPARSTSR